MRRSRDTHGVAENAIPEILVAFSPLRQAQPDGAGTPFIEQRAVRIGRRAVCWFKLAGPLFGQHEVVQQGGPVRGAREALRMVDQLDDRCGRFNREHRVPHRLGSRGRLSAAKVAEISSQQAAMPAKTIRRDDALAQPFGFVARQLERRELELEKARRGIGDLTIPERRAAIGHLGFSVRSGQTPGHMPAVLADAQRRSKEDAVADEAAPEDRRRKRPDVLAGFHTDQARQITASPQSPDQAALHIRGLGNQAEGVMLLSPPEQPRNEEEIPGACLDNRRPWEKGVTDRVPYRTDTEVINGVLVREELEHLPDSPLVLLRMVQPAHKRSHAMPPWELSGSLKRPCLLKIPAWPGRCGMSGHIIPVPQRHLRH